MDEIGNTNKSSVEISKNKGTSGRPNYKWQKNTTVDIEETRCDNVMV